MVAYDSDDVLLNLTLTLCRMVSTARMGIVFHDLLSYSKVCDKFIIALHK